MYVQVLSLLRGSESKGTDILGIGCEQANQDWAGKKRGESLMVHPPAAAAKET